MADFIQRLSKAALRTMRDGPSSLMKDTLQIWETGYSKKEQNDPEWELHWLTERFIGFLECGNKFCGEIVTVCGSVHRQHHEQYEEALGGEVSFDNTYYSPSLIHPAPPVFAVSKKLNKDCAAHLRKAFELLWVDPASCANRIRIFVERLLDQFGVPCVGVNKKGDDYDMNLAQRIEFLEGQKPGHKDAFDAMRNVGNYGSHQGKAKFDTLIDCFEILEEMLKDLVDGRKSRLEKMTAALLVKGGDF
ncbi:DUF4145 domain-containing protein [Mesorhizobium sp. M8A.F.Ca.ET.165.01.1.1]|uniref:DUF4145 domain-containing protein n=1 Tax=Mesorhizobium sp. M8A.F.Ca.ET.165.01.1.1 TaxID=2563960 RepID=UPI00167689ED|nr:DUF4145 domain-containing protein [Mesorhizobium sp. M8A.F.Ca.ET.165.01.1.1]